MDPPQKDNKSSNKYIYMDENEKVDMKQRAQKIAEKTQRALHVPMSQFIPHPKDEKLLEEDSPNSNNATGDNGIYNNSYNKHNNDPDELGAQPARRKHKKQPSYTTQTPNFSDIKDNRSKVSSDPLNNSVPDPYNNPPRNPPRRVPTGAGNYNRPMSSQVPSMSTARPMPETKAPAHHSHPFYQQYPPDNNPHEPHSAPPGMAANWDQTPNQFMTFPLNTGPNPNGMGPEYTRYRSTDSLVNVDTRKLPKKGDWLSFHNIVYKVQSKKYLWSKPTTKTILNGVSGIMAPGVNAIMGPTGSGKSSILDVMAGRKDPQFLDGKVLINGNPQPKNFKCMSGYVVQDDIVMGTLTVKENLMFSAALRLPMKISREEKEQMVISIIDELGLSAVANSKIGTELLRGVSGGERKRTNIAMELITNPKVLFLDEPTTGLDAFTAASVVKTLQKLSRKGKTIILSIHQPKYSIYKLFDRYTLMAKGRIIYHGKAGSAPISYFHNLGYQIEPHNNPADFYIDIINGEVKNEKEILDQQIQHARRHIEPGLESSGEYSDMRKLGRHKSDVKNKPAIVNELAREWMDSQNQKELRNQLQQYDTIPEDEFETDYRNGAGASNSSGNNVPVISYATPWSNQMNWVCWRTALNLLRNPQTSSIQLGVYLFFALSMGIVYYGLKKTFNGQDDRYGLFFFACLQVMFVNLGAIEIFIKERPIFIHETSSGYYRISSYFFAKILCDMVPIKVFPAIIFLPITYFMAHLRLEAGAFFFFELILLLTTAAGCSIAFFTSATFSVFGLANVVTPIIYVFMMVFSGFLIGIDSVFPWLNWCQYLSAFRFCLFSLSVNEMKGVQFCPSNKTAGGSCELGDAYLSKKSIPYETTWLLWSNVVGLTVISLVFLTLCYIQLRRINKFK